MAESGHVSPSLTLGGHWSPFIGRGVGVHREILLFNPLRGVARGAGGLTRG